MKKLFLLLFVAIFFASCKNEKTDNKKEKDNTKIWSDNQRKAFIDDCLINVKLAAPEKNLIEYCTCLQEKIEQICPDPNNQKALTKERLNELNEICLKFIPIPDN